MTGFDLKQIIGEPDPGTKIYRKRGPESEFMYWYDAIVELYGMMVSPGGASRYCPISRAAVYKRLKEGTLTGYFFHPETPKRNFFGKVKTKIESPYGFIAITELKKLNEELEKRAIKQGYISKEELEGDEPDWHGDFLEWNSKFAKQKQSTKGK